MRALFATTAGEGHFGPMVPFARACAAAGHEVRVAAPASFAEAVERAGFGGAHHLPVPDAPPDEMGAIDQWLNAAAVARAGAGRWIDGLAPGAGLPDPAVLAAGLPDAVTAVVAEPAYRQRARVVADEMAALPAPSAAVALFEDLAAAASAP